MTKRRHEPSPLARPSRRRRGRRRGACSTGTPESSGETAAGHAELVNHFDYDCPAPGDPDVPFSVTTTLAPTPWNPDTELLRIGIRGLEPEGGTDRVILATDGDFNVGLADTDALVDLIEREREAGVALTTLGFGSGNYDDELMERPADAGDGSHAYIDTLSEARKVLAEQLAGTLFTIASDVEIQLELNPAVVSQYRLIGHGNRILAEQDFTDDAVDAGEIGAAHQVTTLYEIVRVGSLDAADDDFRFAAAVAAWGELLRDGRLRGATIGGAGGGGAGDERGDGDGDETGRNAFGHADVRALASGVRGEDAFGCRSAFLELVGLAEALDGRRRAP